MKPGLLLSMLVAIVVPMAARPYERRNYGNNPKRRQKHVQVNG